MRKAAIQLTMVETETLSRYGDAAQQRPVGVETWWLYDLDMGGHAQKAQRFRVESERRVRTIERAPARLIDWRSFYAESAKPAQRRTRFNNCTGDKSEISHMASESRPPAISTVGGNPQFAGWLVQSE